MNILDTCIYAHKTSLHKRSYSIKHIFKKELTTAAQRNKATITQCEDVSGCGCLHHPITNVQRPVSGRQQKYTHGFVYCTSNHTQIHVQHRETQYYVIA